MNPFLGSGTAHSDYVDWAERANCKGKAFELFEYQEKDSPLTEGMKYKDRIAFNKTNFDLAAEVCIECPVMFECLENATDEDRMWTVRGGEPPQRFDEESKRYDNVGRPKGAKNKSHEGRDVGGQFASSPDRVCKRGHRVLGGGRCKDCKREGNTLRQREYRKAARRKAQDGVSS